MHHLVRQRRITSVIVYAGAVNVAAGLLLYWRASAGLSPAWIGSPAGIGFTLGGLAAIAAFILGMTQIAPTVNRLDLAGTAMASAGRPPTPAELAGFHELEVRLHRAGLIDTVLLAIAILMMAASRYLT
jgi:hypothetical protein